jgi:flagellar hook protein FlgE
MGVSSAMRSGVSGLLAQSENVNQISANISNSETVGYKRNFVDLVTTSSGTGGSGVTDVAGQEVSKSGEQVASDSATDLMIDGDGYFVVSKNPNETVSTNYYLTRAGSFTADADGYLVNDAGYYLAGYVTDASGNVGTVDYSSYDSLETVSISGQDTTAAFVSTMEYYDALGASHEFTLSWQASDTTDNLWTLSISDETGLDYGTIDITFNDSGDAAGSPATYTATEDADLPDGYGLSVDQDTGVVSLTVNSADEPQTIDLSLGEPGSHDGITQFAGDFETQTFTTDGSATSALSSTTVTGNAWSVSSSSGTMTLHVAGQGSSGTVVSGALESSTVELEQELTDLIVAQRAYSSNATIITTADEMLQEANSLK